MFDEKHVEQVSRQRIAESSPYSKIFRAFKEAVEMVNDHVMGCFLACGKIIRTSQLGE